MYEQRRTVSGTILQALIALPAAGLLAAGTLLSPSTSYADSATCHGWHVSHHSSNLIATGDIYRVCDDRLEILIVEDDHRTMVTYAID